MENTKEMNLFDLCAAAGRAVGRGSQNVRTAFGRMIKLTWRMWWIVLPIMALVLWGALHYSRKDNRLYKVNAVAVVNGATKDVLAREFEAIAMNPYRLAAPMAQMGVNVDLANYNKGFRSFDLIDYMADNTADLIDLKRKAPVTDTLMVHVPDMLALQFKTKRPNDLAVIQEAIMQYLNSRESLQKPYAQFRQNLEREAKFHHDQLEKLDSLTSVFYFSNNQIPQVKLGKKESGMILGTSSMELFLDQIHDEMQLLRKTDTRLAYASAPVVLQSEFVVDPAALNGRIKMIALGLVLGWLLGLAIAALVEDRKKVLAWLNEK
jgi:hypothetical protein